VAERSNAAVLKTVELRGSGGSNPSSSAKQELDESPALFVCSSPNITQFTVELRGSGAVRRCDSNPSSSAQTKAQCNALGFLLFYDHSGY
tara:strand:- start:39 stop:308 length:270 start_codon:yes stop_codon:yes gene_type:complete